MRRKISCVSCALSIYMCDYGEKFAKQGLLKRQRKKREIKVSFHVSRRDWRMSPAKNHFRFRVFRLHSFKLNTENEKCRKIAYLSDDIQNAIDLSDLIWFEAFYWHDRFLALWHFCFGIRKHSFQFTFRVRRKQHGNFHSIL